MYGAMYDANAPWLRRLPAVWRAVWPGEFKTGQGLVGQVSSSVVKQPPRALNNGVVVGVCRRSLLSWSRSSWSLSLSVLESSSERSLSCSVCRVILVR